MKILIVTPYFFPNPGGVENYTYYLSKNLIDLNNEIVIISTTERKKILEEFIDGIHIYRLPITGKISSTPFNPFWNTIINDIIDKEKPDIINGHIPVPIIADIACRIAYVKKIPYFLTYHNDLTSTNFYLKLFSYFYYFFIGFRTMKMSEKIIATSEYYSERSPYLRRFKEKIDFVPPGVDIEKIDDYQEKLSKEKPESADMRKILFVGHLDKGSRHKGLDYLLKAIQIVKKSHDNVILFVVGAGNYQSYYKRIADSLNIGKSVSFLGYLNNDMLYKKYYDCDVLVLPSYNEAEGFGMVIIEANAFKKPTIGTNVGGIPYAIKDNKTGLIVEPRDPYSLADAIIRILTDPILARRLGEAGYARISEEFTWTKCAEKTIKIFKSTKKSIMAESP
jgi:glycosyltransferase involved in cell wall biosynthesis